MNEINGNLTFKCTWNDAGFKGICSQSAYEYNISKNRAWCQKAPCRTFKGIPSDKDHPCYESIIFSEWRFVKASSLRLTHVLLHKGVRSQQLTNIVGKAVEC